MKKKVKISIIALKKKIYALLTINLKNFPFSIFHFNFPLLFAHSRFSNIYAECGKRGVCNMVIGTLSSLIFSVFYNIATNTCK